MSTALLIVDIQNDYFPGGAMELAGSAEAGAQAGKLLDAFRRKALPVIHIQHIANYSGATFFLPDTQGVEIHPAVAPRAGEAVFQKHYPNSFRDTPLLAHLRETETTHLIVAGMMTHMCIDTTVRAAVDLGLTCSLASDACATKALTHGGVTVAAENVQAAFLAALSGTFAKLQSTDELCGEL
ncbi:MAG: cysteine hydrolase [Burkholderiaceae bacterium]|nr:cysteine hydrolase [Sulfuritalea sp.]MCF8174194.1 cysteine hydrolase [Burkholderiaceae bacterium]